MGYKHRQGETPPHQPNITTQKDNTDVKLPKLNSSSAQADSAKTNRSIANSSMMNSNGYGPALNFAYDKNKEADEEDKRSKESKNRDDYGKKVANLKDK